MLERLNEEIRRRAGCAHLPQWRELPAAGAGTGGRDPRKPARATSLPQHGRSAREHKKEALRRAGLTPRPPFQLSTVLALSIGGSGGHLAVPPFPHHRAYGPLPRRLGGLSTRQLFHRKQTRRRKRALVKGAMQRFRRAQSPWSLWAENGRTGQPCGDVKERLNKGLEFDQGGMAICSRRVRNGSIGRG